MLQLHDLPRPDSRCGNVLGQQVQLRATGYRSYSWTPAEGLSDPRVANPIASPAQTTTYTVEMRDACGIPIYDEVTVSVGDPVFFDLGPDTTICEGQRLLLDASSANATYAWNTHCRTYRSCRWLRLTLCGHRYRDGYRLRGRRFCRGRAYSSANGGSWARHHAVRNTEPFAAFYLRRRRIPLAGRFLR